MFKQMRLFELLFRSRINDQLTLYEAVVDVQHFKLRCCRVSVELGQEKSLIFKLSRYLYTNEVSRFTNKRHSSTIKTIRLPKLAR